MTRFLAPFVLTSSLILFLFPHFSIAQDRCGTVAFANLQRQLNPKLPTDDEFEKWMRNKLRSGKIKPFGVQSGPYIIPIVVHVIHYGEAIGTGVNISDAQIISQIDVLNKDYKRLNADAASTPSEFVPVAGQIDMQFVLAQQDPDDFGPRVRVIPLVAKPSGSCLRKGRCPAWM